MKKKEYQPYLLLLPVILVLILIVGAPLVKVFQMSFYNLFLGRPNPPFTGFENYARLISDAVFRKALLNSAVFTLFCIVSMVLIGLGLSLLVNTKIRGRTIFRILLLLPWAGPMVVASIVWLRIYDPQFGLLNYLLRATGLVQKNILWLQSPSLALASVIVVTVWKFYPIAMLFILAGLQGIPEEHYEAAAIDGANALQSFIFVTLPGLRFVLLTLLVFLFIVIFTHFDIIFIMTEGGPMHASETLAIMTYLQAFKFFRFGYSAAIGITLLVLTSMATLVFFYISEVQKPAQ